MSRHGKDLENIGTDRPSKSLEFKSCLMVREAVSTPAVDPLNEAARRLSSSLSDSTLWIGKIVNRITCISKYYKKTCMRLMLKLKLDLK